MELKELIKKLEKVGDPRRTDRGHILHKLVDILIIALCCLRGCIHKRLSKVCK